MKIILVFFIASCILACTEKVEEKAADVFPKQSSIRIIYVDPVDSAFATHFALLDSVLTNKYASKYYPEHRIQGVMEFMSTITGIPAKGDGNFLGWFYDEITPEQYQQWKEWYTNNKVYLKWDETNRKVVRK